MQFAIARAQWHGRVPTRRCTRCIVISLSHSIGYETIDRRRLGMCCVARNHIYIYIYIFPQPLSSHCTYTLYTLHARSLSLYFNSSCAYSLTRINSYIVLSFSCTFIFAIVHAFISLNIRLEYCYFSLTHTTLQYACIRYIYKIVFSVFFFFNFSFSAPNDARSNSHSLSVLHFLSPLFFFPTPPFSLLIYVYIAMASRSFTLM